MSTEIRRILLVDDCVEDSEYSKRLLRKAVTRDWRFTEALNGVRGLALATSAGPFDCILVDFRLPDMDGMEFLKLLGDQPGVQGSATVMLTGTGDESVAVRAMKQGADDYISKESLTGEHLFRVVENAITHFQAARAQRKITLELVESEERFRGLADAMPQIVWTADPNGGSDYFNRRWYESTGPVTMQPGDEGWTQVIHPQDFRANRDGWNASVRNGSTFETQSRLLDWKTGAHRWYLLRALPQRNSQGVIVKWVGTATDVDEKKKKSDELEHRVGERTEQLSRSLAETTTLLQEVHHRVKNNLQVVCSLLSMQVACLGEHPSAGPLIVAHSRVLAMSLIHEQIYQSETLADLDFAQYIEVLGDQLFVAYCVDPARIRLVREVESIRLTIDEAIPCGLILNELLSNSLKHAFTDGRAGRIRISFRQTDARRVQLRVEDNGVGLPADFRAEASSSMGMQVVRSLAHQIRADLTFANENGASTQLTWSLRKPAETQPAAA